MSRCDICGAPLGPAQASISVRCPDCPPGNPREPIASCFGCITTLAFILGIAGGIAYLFGWGR